jgi:hypothetical protein
MPPFLLLFLLLAGAHGLRRADLLGPVESPEYLDDIIIRQKSTAAREAVDPNLLFVGDSSCLMDFSARELERLTPGATSYNLGSLSTLGLPRFAEFTARFLAAHTNVQTVALLISPEMVRSGSAGKIMTPALPAEWDRSMRALREESNRIRELLEKQEKREALFGSALALPFIKTQLVARLFEIPYPGELGNTYGFPSGVREFMNAHNGSAVDPSGEFKQTQRRAPSIDPENLTGFAGEPFRQQCEVFRRALPSGIKLWVGLTPEPAGVCETNRVEQVCRTLQTLKEYLRADGILTNLPATLPDHCFSTTTHLNPGGAREFTHSLAAAIERQSTMLTRISTREMTQAQGAAPAFTSGAGK